MKYLELLEQLVNEINMSPSSLRQLSAGIDARAGMEFEMYFPGIGSIDDDYDDFESTPDYDYDESINDFDDIARFFHDGDHNSSRAVQRLINSLESDFHDSDWLSEKKQEAWADAAHESIKDLVNRDYADDLRDQASDEISKQTPEFGVNGDEFQEAILDRYQELFDNKVDDILANMGPEYDEAYDEWEQEVWPDYINEEDLQRRWLEDEGYHSMSDISNSYDIEWPHWTEYEGGNSAEGNLDSLADSFGSAVGKHVNYSTSYHGARRNPTDYALEPDGSLDEKDDEDDAGVEFVSPPMPVSELLQDLHAVKKWADRNGCYTNESTGLHINVSVPGFSMEKLDYVKLAILLGDEYVLEAFGRSGNTYCKSALGIVKNHIKTRPQDAAALLNQMKEHLSTTAAKALHSGVTSKYTSINTKTGYIEFRSPGGDWLDSNFDKIENTLLRFVVALDAALDETKYKQEYAKKLYKLLAPGTNEPGILELFANYSAGELDKAALIRQIRQKQIERNVSKNPAAGQKYWWNVQWDANRRIEVVATNKQEARAEAAKEWNVPVENLAVARVNVLRPYEEPKAQSQYQGDWGIWITSANRFANHPFDYNIGSTPILYRFPSKTAAEQWIEQRRAENPNMRTDIEVREIDTAPATDGENYEIFSTSSGRTLPIQAANDDEALARLQTIRASHPGDWNVRRVGEPDPTTTARISNI